TKPAFELTLASGRRITATANHKFLTYDGWMPLAELMPGSRIGSVRHVPAPLAVIPRDDDEVVLLAHLLGAGSFAPGRPIRYAGTNDANLSAAGEAAARRFGIRPVTEDFANGGITMLRLPAPLPLGGSRRDPVAAWLAEADLTAMGNDEKFVPDWVFSMPKAQIGLFLRHIWATCGSVYYDDRHQLCTIRYASTSRRMVDDLARLLLRFNVFTRIKRARTSGDRVWWHLQVEGREDQLRFLDKVGAYGRHSDAATALAAKLRGAETALDTGADEVWRHVRDVMTGSQPNHADLATTADAHGPIATMQMSAGDTTRLRKVAGVLGEADLEVQATNDVRWDAIISIEPVGERPVYDATVMGLHNFVVEGIAAHNSLEQDADMVILLHRDDVYERESTRPGEADLIVAKHRNGPTRDITVAFQGHYSRFVDMAH
ncbi:MAG: LAGLIDADG family homing endonuclease, partial [Nocardioides sp.]